MIDLIVPPIILILIVAILITILARAAKNSSDFNMDVIAKDNDAEDTVKKKFFGFLRSLKNKFFGIFESFEKIASKRYLLSKKYEDNDLNVEPKICIIDDNNNDNINNVKDYSKKEKSMSIFGKNRKVIGDIVADFKLDEKDAKKANTNTKLVDLDKNKFKEPPKRQKLIFDAVESEDNENDFVDYRERYFVEQIQANPRNLTSYEQLGDYYMEINKFKEARESFEYVLKIDPQNTHAKEVLERLDKINLD